MHPIINQKFLMENKIYSEESCTKIQLLEVLKTKSQYYVDNESAVLLILRFSPYFCIFN